ncbi:hypothetical protein HBA54_07550 [Pelagibius litoralis]|uniref:Uncharacterized protein n=1 Tax=Pelagibius litoralis TaxID=374515 RepID=A0A967C4U5_9PROT|nr:hypothetical protein [Pelagibius litoralis]NIA68445.1 hypothetical protein [Pelagibius litoralis]
MAKKRDTKKTRNEQILATTKGEVSEIALTVDPQTGEIRFENDMLNVYSEVNYDRPKGPKILSRIPQSSPDVSFDSSPALAKNFDFICAVDTNTRRIQGKKVSVVGIVIVQHVLIPEKEGFTRYWQYHVPFCLEYLEIKSSPENFGWLAALEHLKIKNLVEPDIRIGMIVDSDLGNIDAYNKRTKPVDGPDYLPGNVQLIYASGDTNKSDIVNKVLSGADSAASQCLNAIDSGSVPFNTKQLDNNWFEGLRIISPNSAH